MRNAQQRGALCAHGERRNCLYQRQFRARGRHTTLVPPRGAPQGRWEFSPPSPREVPRRGGGSSRLPPRGRCPVGAVGVTPSVCAAWLPSQLPHRGCQGDGGSSCPPCVREGGAAELRRKGCRVILRCKRRFAINHRYKQGFPAQYAPNCCASNFQVGVNAGEL